MLATCFDLRKTRPGRRLKPLVGCSHLSATFTGSVRSQVFYQQHGRLCRVDAHHVVRKEHATRSPQGAMKVVRLAQCTTAINHSPRTRPVRREKTPFRPLSSWR